MSILYGEAADFDLITVKDWSAQLKTPCEGYATKDIYNADETGMFVRALPTRSLVVRGLAWRERKSNEKITLYLACPAIGEKLTPLVIGLCANPSYEVC